MKKHSHNRVTETGIELGKNSAWLAEKGRIRLEQLGLSAVAAPMLRTDMCKACACRPGTVPNGCVQTQLDFLKAASEGVPFLCHAPHDGKLCAGWVRVRAVLTEHPMPSKMLELVSRYEFSPPDIESCP
jgi:hypothetical protein